MKTRWNDRLGNFVPTTGPILTLKRPPAKIVNSGKLIGAVADSQAASQSKQKPCSEAMQAANKCGRISQGEQSVEQALQQRVCWCRDGTGWTALPGQLAGA